MPGSTSIQLVVSEDEALDRIRQALPPGLHIRGGNLVPNPLDMQISTPLPTLCGEMVKLVEGAGVKHMPGRVSLLELQVLHSAHACVPIAQAVLSVA